MRDEVRRGPIILFPIVLDMHKQRQYRGGYEFSGLVKLARELRQNQTSAEAFLWDLLRDRKLLGFKFRRQHQFGDYVADFYCRAAQLVIECDGFPHHGNERWHHDQNRDAYLISHGLRVMRFKNEEVLNETDRVLSDIAARLNEGKGKIGVGR